MKRTIILTLLLCMAVTASAQFGRSGPERQPFGRGAYRRGEFGGGWSPLNHANCSLYLDARYSAADNAWVSLSPNLAVTFAQANGALQPVLTQDVQNGLPGMLFTTANAEYMSAGDVNGIYSNTNGLTIFLVVKPAGAAGSRTFISKYSVTNLRQWFVGTSEVRIQELLTATNDGADLTPSASAQIISGVWTPGSAAKSYVNGSLAATATVAVTDIPTGTANLLLGALYLPTLNWYYRGYLFTIVAYSRALGDAERLQVELGLNNIWRIY